MTFTIISLSDKRNIKGTFVEFMKPLSLKNRKQFFGSYYLSASTDQDSQNTLHLKVQWLSFIQIFFRNYFSFYASTHLENVWQALHAHKIVNEPTFSAYYNSLNHRRFVFKRGETFVRRVSGDIDIVVNG